jgi:hypothetical protein
MGFRSLIRVSEQIRRFVMEIMNGMEIDDLDDGMAFTDGGKVVSATSPSIIVA